MFEAAQKTQLVADNSMSSGAMERVTTSDERAYSLGSPNLLTKLEDIQPTLSWFGLGGVRLRKRIFFDYVPDWFREELEYVSLVGQLDHPFTRSENYFPSVLLDELQRKEKSGCK